MWVVGIVVGEDRRCRLGKLGIWYRQGSTKMSRLSFRTLYGRCWPNGPSCGWNWPSHRYCAEEISLAKAAALAGVSWERMREILLSRGIQPFLGPETEAEAIQKVKAMERIAHEDDR